MNITYFVGNGLDLKLGLETSYKSFYNYYCGVTDNKLSDSIDSNYDQWADLELGLGKNMSTINSDEELDEFLDNKEDLDEKLATYLLEQNNKIALNDATRIKSSFVRNIINLGDILPLAEQDHFKSYQSKIKGSIKYHFVVFNYTDIIDRIYNLYGNETKKVANHACGSTGYNDVFCKPIHIHGSLNDINGIITGLNDKTQIKNDVLQKKQETDQLIKSYMNNFFNNQRSERVKKIIDESMIICIFGMSLGETDSDWWKYIVEWLLKDSDHRLLVFTLNKSSTKSSQRLIRMQSEVKQKLLKYAELDDEKRTLAENNIITTSNPNFFKLEGITIKKMVGTVAAN